jgi:hypothetical protein
MVKDERVQQDFPTISPGAGTSIAVPVRLTHNRVNWQRNGARTGVKRPDNISGREGADSGSLLTNATNNSNE